MDILFRECVQEFGGATAYHNFILNELGASSLKYRPEYLIFGDGMRLIMQGDKNKLYEIRLTPYTDYDFECNLYDYDYIEPDFMIFRKSDCKLNSRQNRVAGLPALIVEVWSKSNTREARHYKKYLYSTASIIEHWYIEQNSNEIECYLGKNKISPQSLSVPAKTTFGLELDLTPVSLENRIKI